MSVSDDMLAVGTWLYFVDTSDGTVFRRQIIDVKEQDFCCAHLFYELDEPFPDLLRGSAYPQCSIAGYGGFIAPDINETCLDLEATITGAAAVMKAKENELKDEAKTLSIKRARLVQFHAFVGVENAKAMVKREATK